MVNLEWYRTFKAIYQQGNLTRAAQELLISQPNVSVHLAALESYVGGQLFERLPRKMMPTELGKQLYTQIIGSLEQLEAVEYSFTKAALQKQSVIRIGTPKEFFHAIFTTHISGAESKINVSFGLTKELMSDLEKGKLDFVIATHKTVLHKHIVYEPLLEEHFIIVGSAGLDMAELEKCLTVGDLAGAEGWLLRQNWFAYSHDLALIRRFWLQNFRKRPTIIPKVIIPDLNTIVKSISKGEGVGIIPDYLAAEYIRQGSVKIIWSGSVPASNVVYLAYDRSKVSPKKVAEIKKLISMT